MYILKSQFLTKSHNDAPLCIAYSEEDCLVKLEKTRDPSISRLDHQHGEIQIDTPTIIRMAGSTVQPENFQHTKTQPYSARISMHS